MTVSPVGLLSLTKHRLRDRIAASATWALWCGVGVTPADRVHLNNAPARPSTVHAIINHAANFRQERDGAGGMRLVQSGDLTLYLCDKVAAGASDLDAVTDFENRIQALMSEIMAPLNGGHGLTVTGWAMDEDGAPLRIPSDQRDKFGDLIFCELILTYSQRD